MSETTTSLLNAVQTIDAKPTHGVFGGTYKAASEEIYEFLLKRFDETVAHKVAHAYACDYGTAIRRGAVVTTKAKAGATSKTGAITLRESTSAIAKGAESTPALQIGHAIQWLSDAGKHGISFGNTDWKFTPALESWLAGITVD